MKPPRDFASLLRAEPPSSPDARWRKLFDEHGLVWTAHNLITPAAAPYVDAEARRLEALDVAPPPVTNGKAASLADAASFVAAPRVPDVEVRPSSLPGPAVGLGLFASHALAAGDVIGEYTGLVCLVDDVEERGAYAYQAWPGAPVAVDACTAGCHTRFVNHADDPNLDIVQCVVALAWHVLYVARRDIAAGEELFVHYGDTYWRRRRMVHT